ncbi:MAG: hypothetical protein KBS95_07260 [Alistipes sp.]|nr:hypothetical protein [Candidatus Alistipes equi]
MNTQRTQFFTYTTPEVNIYALSMHTHVMGFVVVSNREYEQGSDSEGDM